MTAKLGALIVPLFLHLLHSATAFCSSSDRSNNNNGVQGVLTTSDALSFVTDICGTLKEIKRKGWMRQQIPFPESDSDHMHRCAMCALLVSQPADPRDSYEEGTAAAKYHPSNVDTTKLLKMALTHDLCESIAGDVTPYCGVTGQEKYDTENAAMERIRTIVGDPLGLELFEYWREYEHQQTVEAIYCKDIDKFEMVVQAFEYERKYLEDKPDEVNPLQDIDSATVKEQPLRRFFQSTRSSIRTPLFRRLDQELRLRRQEMLLSKGWAVTETEKQDYTASNY